MVLSVQLHTFACGYPILPAPFVEKIALSPLNSLGILAKSYLTLNSTSYSWTLSYSIGLYVCLCTNTTLGFLFFSFCINYHTVLMTDFVVSLEIRKCEFFSFILFLRLFWLFRVPWDLRMGFSISTKTITGSKSSDFFLFRLHRTHQTLTLLWPRWFALPLPRGFSSSPAGRRGFLPAQGLSWIMVPWTAVKGGGSI